MPAWENTLQQIIASLPVVVPTSEECEKRWRVLSEVGGGGGSNCVITLLMEGCDGPESSPPHCRIFPVAGNLVVTLVFGVTALLCASTLLMSSTSSIIPARSNVQHFVFLPFSVLLKKLFSLIKVLIPTPRSLPPEELSSDALCIAYLHQELAATLKGQFFANVRIRTLAQGIFMNTTSGISTLLFLLADLYTNTNRLSTRCKCSKSHCLSVNQLKSGSIGPPYSH